LQALVAQVHNLQVVQQVLPKVVAQVQRVLQDRVAAADMLQAMALEAVVEEATLVVVVEAEPLQAEQLVQVVVDLVILAL
jgi:hypothetical protein